MAGHKLFSNWVETPDFDFVKAQTVTGPMTGPLAIVVDEDPDDDEAPEKAVDETEDPGQAEGADGALDAGEANLEATFGPVGKHAGLDRSEIQPLPISKAVEALYNQGLIEREE